MLQFSWQQPLRLLFWKGFWYNSFMRQRRIKDIDEKLNSFDEKLFYKKEDGADSNRSVRPLYLEVGCGKGRFIEALASANPQADFVAVEGLPSVVYRAMTKVRDGGLENVRFITSYLSDTGEWFQAGELDGIYLNFSDPWPKNRHSKRRLTHGDRLKNYAWAIKIGGFIRFKTDNEELFRFTVEQIEERKDELGLEVGGITYDLHSSSFKEGSPMTEYEEKFTNQGKKIMYVELVKIKEAKMAEGYMAAINGRKIPKEDKVFGISTMAQQAIKEKGRENVINATIGALVDDEGTLTVLSSVNEAFKSLEPSEYAAYAPIGGTPEFKAAAIKAAFGDYDMSGRYLAVVATMGGTGGIKNTVSNYSAPGEAILTSDWRWGPYNSISDEMGRTLETFQLFTEDGEFNGEDFEAKVKEILARQDRLVIVLNTPAHNPTGYSMTVENWQTVKKVLEEVDSSKKIALLVDAAYIDFAGDEHEVRAFLPVLKEMPANVLPIMGYSMSKTFTIYGMRCGAMIAMAPTEEIAEEFTRVNEFSCRSSWSNPVRAAQSLITKIFADEELFNRVVEERRQLRETLLARGRAFEEGAKEAGLKIVPFSAGFFVSVPCSDPEALASKLRKEDIFVIPLAKGVRVSVAAVGESICRILPAKIKATLENL